MTTTLIFAILLIATVVRLNIEHRKHFDPHAITRVSLSKPSNIGTVGHAR